MKRIAKFLLIGLCSVLALGVVAGCASLGIAFRGASYFEGKKEADVAKYFGYDGETVKAAGEYDKALRFSNLVTTMYVDKTTIQKFKNKAYNPYYVFSFWELSNGIKLPNTKAVDEYNSKPWLRGSGMTFYNPFTGQQLGTRTVEQYTAPRLETEETRAMDAAINQKIKSFNNYVQQCRAVEKSNDAAMFNRTPIGGKYYICSIEATATGRFGDLSGTYYTYNLQEVSVYEDSEYVTETHIAYSYDDQYGRYTDEKGGQIGEAAALANEKAYVAKGFESRRKDKGISLVAYIKDGVVVKVDSSR